MNVIIFGPSGMVGQGALRECLRDTEVTTVLSIVRTSTGRQHPKLREIVRRDFLNFSSIEKELSGFEACLFCLGVSSVGISQEDYRRVTYDITLAAAKTLVKLNPQMTFIFISGAGTDSSERGRAMWARVKGQAENALLRLPFKAAYMFRPAVIVPLHGIKSRTLLYRIPYAVMAPILPLLERLFPKYVTTTEKLGRAMLIAAKRGAPKPVLENSDINQL
ncbi:MAG: epimerase [Terriglobia bacterium]